MTQLLCDLLRFSCPVKTKIDWTPHRPFVASLAAAKCSACGLCIIIINSACFLSLVSFWPKIIVRHARISNGARSFIHKCENESEVAARLSVWVWVWVWVEIIENADRQPSQLLSAINSILYDHQGEPRNSSIVANTIKHVCSLFSLSLSLYIYIYSSV